LSHEIIMLLGAQSGHFLSGLENVPSMMLNSPQAEAATGKDKSYKPSDGGGLHKVKNLSMLPLITSSEKRRGTKIPSSGRQQRFSYASDENLLPGVYVCANGEENKSKAPQIIRCVLLLLKCRMWAYVCDERFLLTYD